MCGHGTTYDGQGFHEKPPKSGILFPPIIIEKAASARVWKYGLAYVQRFLKNGVFFFQNNLKNIPPAPPSAAPQGAAAPWGGGIFQIILKKHSIFQKSLKIGKAIFSNSRKCSFFKISIIMGRRKMPVQTLCGCPNSGRMRMPRWTALVKANSAVTGAPRLWRCASCL